MSTQIAPSVPPPNCAVCNQPPTGTQQHLKCGDCKATRYCTKICQKEDWRTHKLVCKQFKNFTTTEPRPSSHHRLAILLPVHEENPKLLWILCRGSLLGGFETAFLNPHLGTDKPGSEELRVSLQLHQRNPYVQRHALDHMVVMSIRDKCEYDGSEANQCIASMMRGKQRHIWRGPAVVMGKKGTDLDPANYQDVLAADVRVLADFLASYGAGLDQVTPSLNLRTGNEVLNALLQRTDLEASSVIPTPQHSTTTTVSDDIFGVEIPCNTYHDALDGPKYKLVKVPATHSIFRGKPTDISVHIQLPLLIQKLDTIPASSILEVETTNSDEFENHIASCLNINADPEEGEDWGMADEDEWDEVIGRVLVVRADKKSIFPEVVEILFRFCHEVCFEMPGPEESMEVKEEFVRNRITKAAFERFFKEYGAKKIGQGGNAWKQVFSPYL